MALTNAPLEGSDVHPLDKIYPDRLSPAEEGALEVSEHLERVSERERKNEKKKPAAAAATRRASTRKAAKKTAGVKKAPAAKRGSSSKRTASVARRSPGGSERARDVAAELLRKAGGEMAVSDLAAKVVSSKRTRIGGKTPAATVAAQIYTAAKNGVLFKKTTRGKVALLNAKAARS